MIDHTIFLPVDRTGAPVHRPQTIVWTIRSNRWAREAGLLASLLILVPFLGCPDDVTLLERESRVGGRRVQRTEQRLHGADATGNGRT